MAQPREATFQQSSPDSSKGGADSYKHDGTPDTRLTAFSPDESSAKSTKLIKSLNLSASDPQPTRCTIKHGVAFCPAGLQLEKDPFITPATSSKPEQNLSATAPAFRPFSSPVVARGSGEAAAGHDENSFDTLKQDVPISLTLSTELHLSRCLVISSPSQLVLANDAEFYLSKLEQLGSPCRGTRQVDAKGPRVYVRFANIRDACMAHRNIQLGGVDWVATFVSPPEFVQFVNPGSRIATPHEGQLDLIAVVRQGIIADNTQLETTIRQIFQSEGDVFAFQRQAVYDDGILRAIIEFSDTSIALDVFSKYFPGLLINGILIRVCFYKSGNLAGQIDTQDGIPTPVATPLRVSLQDVPAGYQSMPLVKTPQTDGRLVAAGHHTTSPPTIHVHPQFTMYPMVYRNSFAAGNSVVFDNVQPRDQNLVSPMATHLPLVGPLFAQSSPVHSDYSSPRSMQGCRPDGRRQNAMRVNRTPYYNQAGHHNHVDVNRIREGIDVRTTIMLRNIPNKVDQVMLKTIVDESSWGKYDFMYLRIDFANDCNVGYAFINFVDPLDIIDFVNARGNQRWNCFKSDKVAEISYATIQGKDCLVQKFRNSSVMLEAPHYRPKLYYTSNGPAPEMAGQEEAFPPPDNQSKMKRSCENAEHVGLFTPNAGQHFRDEQRRRRSQYDRGTRLAALEEYDYETAIQHLYVAP